MKSTLIGFTFSIFSAVASAAIITVPNNNFDIEFDSAQTGPLGNPTIANNIIFFTPVNLTAQSVNGAGLATTTALFDFIVRPKEGFKIASFFLQARGDYVMRGPNSQVAVGGQTRVFTSSEPSTVLVAPISASAPMTVRNGLQDDWVATSTLDLGLLRYGFGDALRFSIELLLSANTLQSDAGAKRAFIEDKFMGVLLEASPVEARSIPEPSTLLLVAGFAAIGSVLRGKAHSRLIPTKSTE